MRRSVLCAPSCAVPSAAPPVASAAPPTPGEAARVPFADRCRTEPHGGTVRAADTSAQGTGTVGDKTAIGDSANSANDVPNSGTTEFGGARSTRSPAAGNTPGYDSDVFDLRGAPRDGADRVRVRLGSREDAVRPGAPFPRADVRR
ncbi:hypothetical protein ACFFSH_26560 [Streptomyces filamentosus]|uniref:Uncharacterized protein n=1 Tax=Streptomyces filamentosus TaxID=67294 RepID=A0A919BG98_STRFL|nr:hypothetical protein [Streptomyces filamentosus]GHF87258.1 hypothetical protein GCM10017667_14760 [Streptomyces filamentosus]